MSYSELSPIYFSKLHCCLEATSSIYLPPFAGSTFRGGLASTMRNVLCSNKDNDCSDCSARHDCVVAYLFQTPPPPDSEWEQRFPTAPHPFIIYPTVTGESLQPGDIFGFEITLIGKATTALPAIVYGIKSLGLSGLGRSRGTFELREVRCLHSGDVVSDGQRLSSDIGMETGAEVVEQSYRFSGRPGLRLDFISPLRIKYEGRFAKTSQFHVIFRNVLRRLSSLSYFHCQHRMEIDFGGLIQAAKGVKCGQRRLDWVDSERYSGRQQQRLKMGGFVGYAEYRGELEQFLPFLMLAQELHVGKGTTYGLGKIAVS